MKEPIPLNDGVRLPPRFESSIIY